MRVFASTLLGLTTAFATAFTPAVSSANNFPDRTITMVVPFTAGGPTDSLARMVAKSMQTTLGQPVVVENKPGAGGNIGTVDVMRKPADGYHDPVRELQTPVHQHHALRECGIRSGEGLLANRPHRRASYRMYGGGR